jgi:uncharacterized delta-60 repeat protein
MDGMMHFSNDPKLERGEMMLKQLLRSALMVALLALICVSLPAAQAAPGDLDAAFAGFGNGGLVFQSGMYMYVPEDDNSNGMALQPDGKVVAVGQRKPNLVVFRYLPDGQRDRAFGGGDGEVSIRPPYPIINHIHPNDVALQSDGKIVVVGRTTEISSEDNSDFLLLRLTAEGELDPMFGEGGFVATNFSGNADFAHAVLIQPDDKVVVCGGAYVGGDYDFAVARYHPDGASDNTFNNDGKATIGFGGDDSCHNLARQSDGKLVLVGDSDNDFAVARLNTNGTLDDNSGGDGSFDGDGKLITGFGEEEQAWGVAIQPDGKIVVLGNSLSPRASHLARYMPSGALDGTFGSGGKRTIPNDSLFDLALQPDGKLLALGFKKYSDGARRFAFHRLNTDGAPDTTFGGDGRIEPNFNGESKDVGRALALLPDGRILAFGWRGDFNLILTRRWPDGSPDSGGKQTHTLSSGYYESAYALAVQPDGGLLVTGEGFVPFSSRSNAFVTRFLPGGQVDTAFGVQGTIQTSSLGSTFRGARAIAVQPDGKLVIAGHTKGIFSSSTEDFLVARWNSNGAPDNSFGLSGLNHQYVSFPGNGDDYGTALALAPDGKIVVAGTAWNGSRQVWGVARLTPTGALDSTFNGSGMAFLDFGPGSTANAVVVQPDGKIVLGGKTSGNDFAVARLLENGAPDTGFGPNHDGSIITDMGGNSGITALALAPNGWIYAAGYRVQNGGDVALAQYTPEGLLATCPPGEPCDHWPDGKRFVNLGGSDSAYALVLRGDNQLVAAGCSDLHMAAAQVSTIDVNAPPLLFRTDFVGGSDCAYGVQFSDADKDKFILAGSQFYDSDKNIALARFETTGNNPVPSPTPTPPPGSNVYPVYLPIIVR